MRKTLKWNQRLVLLGLGSSLIATTACRPTIDPESVQARAKAPLPASVETVRISKDASKQDAFLVVHPIRISERGSVDQRILTLEGSAEGMNAEAEIKTESSRYYNYLLERQRQISLQFVSALSGVGNFRLIDYIAFGENPKTAEGLGSGKGPYFVRAAITECTEEVVSDKRRTSLPLIYRNRKNLIEGIVGLDVSVVDVSSGEVVAAFPVQGSFITSTAKSGGGVVGAFSNAEVRMRSTIDQAIRVALNNAATTLYTKLYENE